MSSESLNPPAEQENAKDKEQTAQESVLKDTYDVEDIVYKNSSSIDPEEIGSNPALAPETVALNDPAEVREGFKFDRD